MNTFTNKMKSGRARSGQALLAGTMLLPLFVFGAMILIVLTFNIAALGNWQGQVQSIASEAARRVAAKRWWIGMARPDRKPVTDAAERAELTQAINAELETIGLSDLKGLKIATVNKLIYGKMTEFVSVEFDVPGMRMISGGILPSATSLHASAVSSNSEQASVMHGMALIHVVDPVTKEEKGLRVPIYNATRGLSTPLNRNILSAGISAGIYPVAYLRLNCPNNNQIHTQHNP